MFINFLEISLIIIINMAREFDLSFSRFESCTHKNFESFELKLSEIKLFVINNGNSFLFLKLFVIISWIIKSSFIKNFKLFILELFFNFFKRSFSIGIMNIDKVRFVKMWNCRVERLFMESSLTSCTP